MWYWNVLYAANIYKINDGLMKCDRDENNSYQPSDLTNLHNPSRNQLQAVRQDFQLHPFYEVWVL